MAGQHKQTAGSNIAGRAEQTTGQSSGDRDKRQRWRWRWLKEVAAVVPEEAVEEERQ